MADKKAVATTNQKSSGSDSKKIGTIGLIAVVISAMVGGGVFDLPQNMAASAGAGAQIIAWIITGVGIWFIANTFRILAQERPDLKNGLYTYAERGFGKVVGFFISYGYWICNCFALAAYGVLIMSTMNFFFPHVFVGGNNWWSVIVASLITIGMYFLAMKGAKSSALINNIGTIGKLIPILVFLIACATVFNFATFMDGFWGLSKEGVSLSFDWSRVMPQVNSTMLVTLWLFIGIEGAVVVSGEAKSQNDVAKATTIGYIIILVLYVLSSLLPLGIYSQTKIGAMTDPSMATLMVDKFGDWGAIIINIGVIISVLSSWLVWVVMLGQMPLYAAHDGIFPKSFKEQNEHGAPTKALIWTTIITIGLLVLCHFTSGNAWNTMISITSVMAMPCYLLCCAFLWKISLDKEHWTKIRFSRINGIVTGVLGTIFSLYLVYAAGLNYLMIACVLYAIGIPLLWVATKENKSGKVDLKTDFKKWELWLMGIVIVLGIVGIFYTIGSGIFTA